MRDWLYRMSSWGTRPSNLFRGGKPHVPVPETQHEFSQLPSQAFAEHCCILAPTGHGKSQLLEILIARFIAEDDSPAIFVIDSQGEMLRTIEILHVFDQDKGMYKDRLVVLDPEDISPPALNLFKMGDAQDATINELFQYLFTAIDSTLTSQQSTTVTYLLRLMSRIPNATIDTLRKVMEDKAKKVEESEYKTYIDKLDPIARDFFANQFYTPGPMQVTRNSVARRLYSLLSNPVFLQIFGASENKFDAVQAFRKRQVVLMNTSQKLLGQDATVLGRYYIAQILAAAYRKSDKSRAILIIDEAWQYLDEKAELILDTARKVGLGLIIATQRLDKIPKSVQSSIYANTAVKFAGPVSHDDANVLAREMNCAPEYIQSMRKVDRQYALFAVHVRNVTKTAKSILVPFGQLDNAAAVTLPQYDKFREINRRRYGTHEGPQSELSREKSPLPAEADTPRVPRLTMLPQHHAVYFQDLDVTPEALLDTGAELSTLPVTHLNFDSRQATFTFAGKTIQKPTKYVTPMRGVGGHTHPMPIVTLTITIGPHTAEEDFALYLHYTQILIGRPFLAGRIVIESHSPKRW